MSTGATTPAEYYADDAVRQRIVEYCGGTDAHPATAAYVAAVDTVESPHPTWEQTLRLPSSQVHTFLHEGHDVARSLWDAEQLIVLFDVDYQNVDVPAEPFTHPAEVFVKLEPTYRAARRVLARFGLPLLSVMTGRGYHFTGGLRWNDPLIDTLAALVPDDPVWLETVDVRRPAGVTTSLTSRQARAATGLGLVQEYVLHLILQSASAASPVPVMVNGTTVGRGLVGRECVSLDLSHLGDPLDVRQVRMAFGTYQWHRQRPDIFGADVAALPPLVALPRGRRALLTMLTSGRGLAAARRLAPRVTTRLPDAAEGLRRALTAYGPSRLAAFHRRFLDAPRSDRLPPLDAANLPPCLAAAIDTPNDLLLKPEHVQHLTRGLLARDWSARQIATLIQQRYERDCGWGDRWTRMEPRTRAEYDVRVFAGLVLTGQDRMVDFNCVSAQEKGLCPATGCAYDLRLDRRALRTRVSP